MAHAHLRYEDLGETTSSNSRVGILHTPIGDLSLPAVSPGVRTRTDVQAVNANRERGMPLQVVSPYASFRAGVGPLVSKHFFPQGLDAYVTVQRPLIVVDPESEALNFSTIARPQFSALDRSSASGRPGPALSKLLSTGFETNAESGTQEARVAWKAVEDAYGLTPILDWSVKHHLASRSDVLLLPTPVMHASAESVRQSLSVGRRMLVAARSSPQFTMHGIHLLLRAELLGSTDGAHAARAEMLQTVARWHGSPATSGIFLSLKVFDSNHVLSNPPTAGIVRRNLSEVLVGLHESVQHLGGVLIAHDVGSLALGFIDSGVDIATVKVSGKQGIDRPVRAKPGPRGPRAIQPITLPRSMVEEDYREVRRVWDETGGYPVPSCSQPIPYWELPGWADRQIHVTRSRCGTFVELADEYRRDAMDPDGTLREAVRSRVNDSGVRQELMDMCASL